MFSALLCGLAPALQSTRVDLVNALKSADVDVPGRKRMWGRNLLVVAQVSMSLMLLTAAFLMARGFQHGLLEDTGFAKDHLLMTSFDPRLIQYNATQTQHFYNLLAERMREIPGVQSAALTHNVPLDQDDPDGVTFVPEGFTMPPDRANFTSSMDTVDEGYFHTHGNYDFARPRVFEPIPPCAARRHRQPALRQALLACRRRRWQTHPPREQRRHARRNRRRRADREISKHGKPADFLYMPLAQHPVARMVLMLRSTGDPLELVQPVKDVVRSLDSNLPMLRTARTGSIT